jgi:hypothetical protein
MTPFSRIMLGTSLRISNLCSIELRTSRHPINGRRDKSVLGGSWIVVVVQVLAHANATHPASLIDPSSRIFKDLDASHPSERAMLCDG